MLLAILLLVQNDLEETLRALEKDIAAVRGLEFKTPVVAKTIPRPEGQGKKIQGYYSLKEKALFLYEDISGAYERGVLIHEMVHALQDQNFGLAKLHQSTFGSDAELAMSALIEGDATFTMIELLKKDQPKVAAMLDSPLEKARDLQGAFLYAQGARYVRALKEKGGWEAVDAVYKNPPRSTAAVLHPEGVQTVSLGPGKTRGELAIMKMLAAQPDTAPLAVKAAAGWRGDAAVEQGDTKSWVVAFATREDALEFQEAMAKLRAAKTQDLESCFEQPGAIVWRGPTGGVLAVLSRGARAYVLEAPDNTEFMALLDRIDGVPKSLLIWSAKDARAVTFGEFLDRLLEADIVLVGETHDSEPHHRIQLQVIKAIFAADESLGVGMEMFQRPFQNALDRYVAGETTEEEFLKDSEYRQRWGFDWSLYKPIVDFCHRNRIPLAALNAPKELTSRISKVGVDGLTDEEKEQLGEVDFEVKEHRDYWFERLGKMHGNRTPTEEQKERSYQVMTVWDEYMGASAAQFQEDRRVRRMLVMAGSGHVDRGFGIAARAAKRTGGRTATVHIAVSGSVEKLSSDAPADFVVIVK